MFAVIKEKPSPFFDSLKKYMYYSGSEYSGTTKLFLVENHRVHTEWQWPFSGVHSIMMEKSAQSGEGATPFTINTITYKAVVYAPAERADIHSPYFYSTPVCTLWLKHRTELEGHNKNGGNIDKKCFFLHGRGFSFCSRGWGMP
jgi:hypothetical protein